MFLISEVEESEGEEPFIDLLGKLPKTLGVLTVVEDEQERKRAKKKHHCEGAEREKIAEAIQTSQHKEEVRLEKL